MFASKLNTYKHVFSLAKVFQLWKDGMIIVKQDNYPIEKKSFIINSILTNIQFPVVYGELKDSKYYIFHSSFLSVILSYMNNEFSAEQYFDGIPLGKFNDIPLQYQRRIKEYYMDFFFVENFKGSMDEYISDMKNLFF